MQLEKLMRRDPSWSRVVEEMEKDEDPDFLPPDSDNSEEEEEEEEDEGEVCS
jgi:hypothetical protein